MKRAVGLMAVAAVVATLSFFSAKVLRSQGVPTPKTPFTITVQERIIVPATGYAVSARECLHAVRSDGSVVFAGLSSTPDSPQITSRTIKLAPDRKRVIVHENVRSTTTEYFPPSAITALTRSVTAATSCIDPELAGNYEVIGHGELMGFTVIKLRRSEDDVTLEHWAAPQLNCDWIYSRFQVIRNGMVAEVTEQVPTSIKLGDPEPDLFAIPSGYSEMPPSAAYVAAAGQRGARETEAKLVLLDQRYIESQRYGPK